MKKLLKISLLITGIPNVFLLFFRFTQALISSKMQGYYKSQIGDFPGSTQELLEKKGYWVEFGTRQIIPEYIIIFFAISFFILVFIALILKFISLKDKKDFLKKANILSGASCVLSILIKGISAFFIDCPIFDFIIYTCCIVFLLISAISFVKKIIDSEKLE